MPVLITCASSALAYKLKKRITSDEILLSDYEDVPQFMINSGQFIKLPSPHSATYQHQMLSLCLDKDIQAIFPLSDNERVALLESRQLFKEYGITIKDIPDDL